MQIRDISAECIFLNFCYVIRGTLLKCILLKKLVLHFAVLTDESAAICELVAKRQPFLLYQRLQHDRTVSKTVTSGQSGYIMLTGQSGQRDNKTVVSGQSIFTAPVARE